MHNVTHVLDTNVLVRLLRGHGQDVLGRIIDMSPGSIAVSSITLAELAFGASLSMKANETERVLSLMKDFIAVPFGESEAWEYGKIRHELHQKGTPIGQLDLLIAAVARCHNWVVVTHNLSEFSRVEGLLLEDWQK